MDKDRDKTEKVEETEEEARERRMEIARKIMEEHKTLFERLSKL